MRYYKENKKAMERFLNYSRMDKSENTMLNYQRSLELYEEFLMKNEVQLIGVNKVGADEYVNFLIEKGYKPSTISNRVVAVREMYEYLVEYGIIEQNPYQNTKTPKLPKRLPTPLTDNELQRLFKVVDSDKDIFYRQRDRLMVTTFIYTGMRLEEASNLRKADLNNRTLNIVGKGDKERQVYLPEAVMLELMKMEEVQRIEDYWFSNKEGKRLSKRGIQQRIKDLMLRADIEGKSVHNLRHTGATLMLDAGADIRAVQDILGHESISTTEGYTRVTITNKKRVAGLLDDLNL